MTDPKSALHWLARGGEMSELIARKDWSAGPLGPIESWPSSLLTTVSLCLASNFPINIIWGPQHVQIYNDGYRIVCGAAHPRALGEPYTVTWASAWPAIGKPFERALAGETSFLENQRMFLERNGYPEETFFTFSLSPIRDESGKVVGLFHPVTETTPTMLSQRRARALRDLAEKAGKARSVGEACTLALESLSDYRRDLPLLLLYLVDGPGETARLAGGVGVDDALVGPKQLSVAGDIWSLQQAAASKQPVHVKDIAARFGPVVCGEYPDPLREALVLPLGSGHGQVAGFLVAGVSTRLPLDESYTSFLTMLGNAVSAALSSARAYEEEAQRAAALAELDRAKTAFFSNVSHEFRTPLTLMLGPLEDMLAGHQGELLPAVKTELEVVHRNSMRLLKLVNALLDFSRIEANRVEASYQATELKVLTEELASSFRSAIERAGMKLVMELQEPGELAWVDREMWEKIILNLLSNAFKYTLRGQIKVGLKRVGACFELSVADSGTGIPEEELPRVFQRFHRVQGTQGRTHEGTGIGLALVHELVKLHGGSVRVESVLGQGSTFSVQIPRGAAHLPQEKLGARKREDEGAAVARPMVFVEEALRLADSADQASSATRLTALMADGELKKRILLADDNADMRDYVKRLLASHHEVTAVADGRQALALARTRRPDLLLTDIMMPVMDGIELLKAIRADPSLKTLPVILLSARAGDEAKAGGIELGADDYLTKPFSARELLARVQTQLHMAQVRKAAIEQEVRAEALARLLQSRDEFLTIVSHELKTPLTSLKLQLQLTQRLLHPQETQPPTKARLNKVFDVSLKQVYRLAHLVEDLLDVSRLHGGRMTYRLEPVELSELVHDAVERFAEQLAVSRCAITVIAPAGVTITCDRFRVDQVVTNLLNNAIKYGAGRPIEIALSAAPGAVQIAVRDQGMGIAADKHARIFDRFERAVSHQNISGLGLGLYIARQIVDAHGGSIAVQSAPGKGSLFTVELPLVPPPDARGALLDWAEEKLA